MKSHIPFKRGSKQAAKIGVGLFRNLKKTTCPEKFDFICALNFK
jgi:hypothetical protein